MTFNLKFTAKGSHYPGKGGRLFTDKEINVLELLNYKRRVWQICGSKMCLKGSKPYKQ